MVFEVFNTVSRRKPTIESAKIERGREQRMELDYSIRLIPPPLSRWPATQREELQRERKLDTPAVIAGRWGGGGGQMG
jgi:hypothetical protein